MVPNDVSGQGVEIEPRSRTPSLEFNLMAFQAVIWLEVAMNDG